MDGSTECLFLSVVRHRTILTVTLPLRRARHSGYGKFKIGGTGYLCSFGSGSAVSEDPTGNSPLAPTCLCAITESGAQSAVIVHDIIFYSTMVRGP